MNEITKPRFNYFGMERSARIFLMSEKGGYSPEDVAMMIVEDVEKAIVKWCEENDYHIVQEEECITLAPNVEGYIYLER